MLSLDGGGSDDSGRGGRAAAQQAAGGRVLGLAALDDALLGDDGRSNDGGRGCLGGISGGQSVTAVIHVARHVVRGNGRGGQGRGEENKCLGEVHCCEAWQG